MFSALSNKRSYAPTLGWGALAMATAISCSDPADSSRPKTRQIEILEPAPVLNPDGSLATRGWARHPLMEYNPEFIRPTDYNRRKEWEHYTLMTPEGTLAITLSEVGLSEGATLGIEVLMLMAVEFCDFTSEEILTGMDFALNDPDLLDLPLTPYGDTVLERGANRVSFAYDRGVRTIEFNIGMMTEATDFVGSIRLAEAPGEESLSTTLPFSGENEFFYENKAFALPATGEVRIGDRMYRFDPSNSFGVLDWGRGVWPTETSWFWGSAGGYIHGQKVGFNIGAGSGDDALGTSNAITVNGVVHKLEDVHWDYDPDHILEPWHIYSSDGRMDLLLTPKFHQEGDTDLGLATFSIDKMHGAYSGMLVLDDGAVLEVEDLLGFSEHAFQKW